MIITDKDPSALIDQRVTLLGIAQNAALGAVVFLADRRPVFISGLRRWDSAWQAKQMKATGILRSRKLAPDPEVNAKGEVSHGMQGEALVLDEATWEEAT